jgi:hypothetical protein
MTHGKVLDFNEKRRANRLDWERQVVITQPVQATGWAINVSAIGLLMRLKLGYSLQQGDLVTVEIPRLDGAATTQRNGRIVRMETTDSEMLLGLELLF